MSTRDICMCPRCMGLEPAPYEYGLDYDEYDEGAKTDEDYDYMKALEVEGLL